ncbi:hypothetical protein [Streptomyces erythrochromogenes]|uniref:hypothetical protein n=1 Tax=Streptomyces erythrochromogenes TaxID=285574 RepID=UPI0036B3EC09
MTLGDALTQEALTTGTGFSISPTGAGGLRLAIRLEAGEVQHFERPGSGGRADWTATDLEGAGSGCAFNEPISAPWGQGLELLATGRDA